eukprot:3324190-Pyramimonas_sp.AAC.1
MQSIAGGEHESARAPQPGPGGQQAVVDRRRHHAPQAAAVVVVQKVGFCRRRAPTPTGGRCRRKPWRVALELKLRRIRAPDEKAVTHANALQTPSSYSSSFFPVRGRLSDVTKKIILPLRPGGRVSPMGSWGSWGTPRP